MLNNAKERILNDKLIIQDNKLTDILNGHSLKDVINIMSAGNLCNFNDIEIILKRGWCN